MFTRLIEPRSRHSRTRHRYRSHARATMLIMLALAPAAALACGPFFPNRILVGSDETLTSAPVADFEYELARIKLTDRPTEKAVQLIDDNPVYRQTAGADVADLAEALRRRGLAPAQVDPIVAAYRKYRDAVQAYQTAKAQVRQQGEPEPQLQLGALPAGLPDEFADYLTGAVAYHRGDLATARRAWQTLLARPEAQRPYRSVWAAYMLGRSYVDSDADKASAYFADARKFAAAGFRDALGLAAASYGWEGKALLNAGRFDRAIELYLTQRDTGHSTATPSLLLVASQAVDKSDAVLRQCAANDHARRVITAYVLAQGGTNWEWLNVKDKQQSIARRWIAAIEAVGGKTDIEGAERLAWVAYQAADYNTASRWVARAGDTSAVALWVRAKLLMRAGRIDEALAALGSAAKLMPADEVWPDSNWYDRVSEWSTHGPVYPHSEMLAEMGALQLTRGQYAEALSLLLDSGDYWADAAYIADQVLKLDELKAFVDASKPPAPIHGNSDHDMDRAGQYPQLRELLARRLTRNGRWKEARDYFTEDSRALLDSYIASIRAGHDKSRSRAERAQSFITAARIAREHGMELLGTELDPDEAIHGGAYGDDDPKAPSERTGMKGPALKPTADELRRVMAHRPAPMRRWHYRYTAADHAWAAAELMTDNTDELAAWLQEAGMWLAAKDPQAADRFYKAMVLRCGSTALGQEANRLHWFPAMKQKK